MSDYAISGDYGDQLILPGLGPQAGDQYRNIHTDEIFTVTATRAGRRAWVTLRHGGRQTEIPADWLEKHYVPFHMPGRGM